MANDEQMSELLPCPFCGADEIEDWGEATWSQPAKWMYCTCCQAQGPRILMNRGEDLDVFMSRVKADWNQRYQPTKERQHDHPPQPSASVVVAMKHLQDIINCGNCSGSRQSARLALKALTAMENN